MASSSDWMGSVSKKKAETQKQREQRWSKGKFTVQEDRDEIRNLKKRQDLDYQKHPMKPEIRKREPKLA